MVCQFGRLRLCCHRRSRQSGTDLARVRRDRKTALCLAGEPRGSVSGARGQDKSPGLAGEGFEDRDPIFWWIQDQLYDSVRDEPRFQALIQKVDQLKEGSKP